jgi:hypothetical protein
LLNFEWWLAGAGLVAALMAVLWARRITKRVERLSQSYWELRYEHGQLNARVGRLEPPPGSADQEQVGEGPRRPTSNFVPLSSLRK